MQLNRLSIAVKDAPPNPNIKLMDCVTGDVILLDSGAYALVIVGTEEMVHAGLTRQGRGVLMLTNDQGFVAHRVLKEALDDMEHGKGRHRILRILGQLSGVEVVRR